MRSTGTQTARTSGEHFSRLSASCQRHHIDVSPTCLLTDHLCGICCTGDPAKLARADKIYAGSHRVVVKQGFFAGAYKVDRLRGELPVTLLSTLTNRGPVITVDVGPDDESTACTVRLRARLTQWTPTDKLELCWDGVTLGTPADVLSAAS